MLAHFLIFGLLANLSTACLDCVDDVSDSSKSKLSFAPLTEEEYQKIVGFPPRSQDGQQKIHFYPRASAAVAQRVPSNLLHVYTLLKSSADPRLVVDDFLGDPVAASRISKKAEKGMLVDVVDFMTKNEDRNRRVGQNMRSSG